MDQQNKTKPEENQNKPDELSEKDLEPVAGGITYSVQLTNANIISPRDPASGLPTGKTAG